jgi:D-aminopeptidase
VGRELGKFYLKDSLNYSADGSCMIVVATDAPLDARNLKRLAARALLGLGATGSSLGNSSGDYVIAFSTAAGTRVPATPESQILTSPSLHNDAISPLFQAVKEATQEAIYNSLFMATTTSGYEGHTVEALPLQRVLEIYRKYNVTLDKK